MAMLTPKAAAFHDAMRELWEYYGTYTERAIVDLVAGNPDTSAVIATLLQHQTDICNAVTPFYGAAGGEALTKLLMTHINDAVAVLKAAKGRQRRRHQEGLGRQIASFLHKANTRNWPLGALQTVMRIDLNQVIGLAVDQIKGKYTAAIALYKAHIDHLNVGMADMLSNGIIKQFSTKFSSWSLLVTDAPAPSRAAPDVDWLRWCAPSSAPSAYEPPAGMKAGKNIAAT